MSVADIVKPGPGSDKLPCREEVDTDMRIHSFCEAMSFRNPPQSLVATHHFIFLDLFQHGHVRRLEFALPGHQGRPDFYPVDDTWDIEYNGVLLSDVVKHLARNFGNNPGDPQDAKIDAMNRMEPFFRSLEDGPARVFQLTQPPHVVVDDWKASAFRIEIGDFETASPRPKQGDFESVWMAQQISADDPECVLPPRIGAIVRYYRSVHDRSQLPDACGPLRS